MGPLKKGTPCTIDDVEIALEEGEWMIHPELLMRSIDSSGLVTRGVQDPGMYLVTLPGVYYCGFSTGVNIQEFITVSLPMRTKREQNKRTTNEAVYHCECRVQFFIVKVHCSL